VKSAVYNGRVAKWCVPDRVIFVESLPVGATGKVQKNTLRELYATARPRRCARDSASQAGPRAGADRLLRGTTTAIWR
jgi:acyl-CoA synthetase (AMP-forming)/AMP-acid ligase II